jgi:hypothetical protein
MLLVKFALIALCSKARLTLLLVVARYLQVSKLQVRAGVLLGLRRLNSL